MEDLVVKGGQAAGQEADSIIAPPGGTAPDKEVVSGKPSFTDDTEVDLGDGKKISFKELKSGYSRQDDYSRKTAELAEERKGLEADKEILDWLKNPEIPPDTKIKALAAEWNVPFEVAKEAVEGLEDGTIDPTTSKELKSLRQEMQGLKKELETRDGVATEKEVSSEIATVREKYKEITDKEMRRILDIAGSPINTRNRVSIVKIADEYFGDLKERDASTIKNYLESKTKDKKETPPPLSGGAPVGDGEKKLSLDGNEVRHSFAQRIKQSLKESSGA